MRKYIFSGLIILTFVVTTIAVAQDIGVRKKRVRPQDYGKVIMNSFSEKNKIAPVEFDHWLHRAKFTCRLCHIDIGFDMRKGATRVRAADNMKGLYCGTCHNGKMVVDGKVVFNACSDDLSPENLKRCSRCHSYGKDVKKEINFTEFIEKLPKERFGNGVDWEQAEKDGLIKPIDYIEGISIKKGTLPIQPDFVVKSKIKGFPDTIFSHEKHAIWNGCEICHPDIFNVGKGTTRYTMTDIFNGKFCGVCHDKVAFPNADCQRCHTNPAYQ